MLVYQRVPCHMKLTGSLISEIDFVDVQTKDSQSAL